MRNLLIVLLVTLAGYSQAVNKVWTNGVTSVGKLWGTAGNWSPSGVPTANDTVIFTNSKSGGNLTVTLGANRSCSNMVFASTNKYTFTMNEYVLNVYGSLSNRQSSAYGIRFNGTENLSISFMNPATYYNGGTITNPAIVAAYNHLTFDGTNYLSQFETYFTEETNLVFNGTTAIDLVLQTDALATLDINGTLITTNDTSWFSGETVNILSGGVWHVMNKDVPNTVVLHTMNMATNSTLYLGAYGGTLGSLSCDAFNLAPDTPPQMDGTINVTLANTDTWEWNYNIDGYDYMPLFNTSEGQTFTNHPTIVINPASDGALAGASFTVLPQYHVPGMPYASGHYRSYIYEDTTSATNSYGTALRVYHNPLTFVLVLEKQTKQARPWMGWMMNQ